LGAVRIGGRRGAVHDRDRGIGRHGRRRGGGRSFRSVIGCGIGFRGVVAARTCGEAECGGYSDSEGRQFHRISSDGRAAMGSPLSRSPKGQPASDKAVPGAVISRELT
jgi:hypothetical protein